MDPLLVFLFYLAAAVCWAIVVSSWTPPRFSEISLVALGLIFAIAPSLYTALEAA